MKKYLKEIEVSAVILMLIGVVLSWIKSYEVGMWPCGVGLFLFLIVFLYKTFHGKMTIQEAQQVVDQWIKTYGVRYFSELTNMAVLTEEVGELARVIARKYGDQSFKAGEKDNLGEEMADVLWVLICLANQTGIDLTKELRKSIEKKTQRDKERHLNNDKLK